METSMTTLVQLDGPGPFQLPAVTGFLGQGAAPRTEQVHILLVLEDGRELNIPLADTAYRNLCRQFYEQHLLNEMS